MLHRDVSSLSAATCKIICASTLMRLLQPVKSISLFLKSKLAMYTCRIMHFFSALIMQLHGIFGRLLFVDKASLLSLVVSASVESPVQCIHARCVAEPASK